MGWSNSYRGMQRVFPWTGCNVSGPDAKKFTRSGDSATQAIVVAESWQWLLLPGLITPKQFGHAQKTVGTPDRCATAKSQPASFVDRGDCDTSAEHHS